MDISKDSDNRRHIELIWDFVLAWKTCAGVRKQNQLELMNSRVSAQHGGQQRGLGQNRCWMQSQTSSAMGDPDTKWMVGAAVGI